MSSKIEYSVNDLTKKLRSIEMDILLWGTSNSQSNPGAMMELRDMHKQRDIVYRALKIAILQEKEEKSEK